MNLPEGKVIILFDGVCNLCNNWVNFVIDRDVKDKFRFVALQSDLGFEIRNHLKLEYAKLDSILVYEPGVAYYYKSEAVFEILSTLGNVLSVLIVFQLLPIGLRDWVYDYIAKNRYKWYGKKESCRLPTPELQYKFL